MFAKHCKTNAFFSKYHSHARRGSFFRWIFAPIFVDISLPCCMALILALFFLCFTTIFSRNVNAARGFCLKYHSHAAWGSFFQRYFGNRIHIDFCPPATIQNLQYRHTMQTYNTNIQYKHTIQNLQYKPAIQTYNTDLKQKPTIQTFNAKPTIQTYNTHPAIQTYNANLQYTPTTETYNTNLRHNLKTKPTSRYESNKISKRHRSW